MSLLKLSVQAAETSAQIIPTANIVYAGLTAFVLVAAAIAGFILLKRHAASWGNAMVYGLLAGIAFIALVPMVLSAIISIIPAWADYLTTNDAGNQVISVVLQFAVTCVAFIVGIILLKRSSEKTHQPFDLGSGIMFGFAVFLVELFVGQQLSICLQYIPACLSVNKMGYDAAIQTVMDSGLTEAEAAEYLKNLAAIGGIDFLLSGLAFVLKGMIEICAGAVAYGLVSKKFSKGLYVFLIAGFVIVFGLDLLFYFTNANNMIYLIAMAVVAALYAFATLKFIKQYLPDEWDQFKKTKTGSTSGFPRKDRAPQKMPKIQMPKE